MAVSVAPGKLWIDGQAQDAVAGEMFDTTNPATGEILTQVARGRQADVDKAVASARRAFEGAWGRTSPIERSRILWKAGELIEQRTAQLALLETQDTGKLLRNSQMIDVPRTAETFYYFSGWATKVHGETIPVPGPFLNYTVREPLGVVAAIVPWNFPFLLAARKVAAALCVGNSVILKPPEEASLTCIELGKILSEAGLPAGALNVVTGYGEEAGAALVAHPGVDKISFTGGTETGKIIMRSCASTLKRVSLELGGKSPNIIFADADLDKAIPGAVSAIFYHNGQICTAGSRLLVQENVYGDVLAGVNQAASQLVLGDPMQTTTNIGPMVSEAHRQRVQSYIDKGSQEGALLCQGQKAPQQGYYVSPTVFGNAKPEMTIVQEEIFGPVLTVLPFRDLDEASALAGATEFGLAAGIWTKDVGRAHALAARIKAGTVWINAYNKFDAASPYGGYKQSGFGRENGRAVLDELTQLKSVWVAMA